MPNFTDRSIKALKPKTTRYYVTERDGFQVRISPKGEKVWVYRYTQSKKTKWLVLGAYPTMSLKDARIAHGEARSKHISGANPSAHKDKTRLLTIKQLTKDFYDTRLINRKRPEYPKQLIESHINPGLGDIVIADLTTAQISDFIIKLGVQSTDKSGKKHGGQRAATATLSLLKQMLTFAKSRGVIHDNPAADIRARDLFGVANVCERTLDLNEIKTVWAFLDSKKHRISKQIVIAVKLLILTGARSGELRTALFDTEVDMKNKLWTIPASKTKSNKKHEVPLNGITIDLFEQLKEINNEKVLNIEAKAMARAIGRVQERIGIPKWTAHDLRRSFATGLSTNLNIDIVTIEKCLGHALPGILSVYQKDDMLDKRRDALEQWAELVT